LIFPVGFFKRPMVMLTVMLFVFAIFIPMAIPGSIFDSFNTEGFVMDHHGVKIGVDFDTANIIGAFTSNADSETFTITGKYMPDGGQVSWLFKSYRYKLYVDGSDNPIQKFPADNSWIDWTSIDYPDTWNYFQPWTTSQKTDGDVRLKVVLEYKLYDFVFITHVYDDNTPDLLGWDGANVLSGQGAIYLPASEIDKSPFEAGESVNVFVKTGFTGGAGWTVMLRPPADRTDLLSAYPITIANIGDNKETYVDITVGADFFKISSTNQWKVELWNQYFDRNYDEILTIDDRARAPIITDISFVNNGDSFSYTVTVEETYATLSFINVDAFYTYGGGTTMPGSGDTESWILQDIHYPVTSGIATFTVYPKANIQGDVVVKVIAYDVDGRPSTPDYESFTVSINGTVPIPPPIEQPFVWTTSAVIVSALLVLGIVAIMWFAPIPINIKIILVMILGIAGAILVWLFGTLQIGG